MKNFHIDRINFQEGVVSCRVDLKSMLIKQLLDKYPELIKDTEEEYPRYLKCVDTLKGNLDWTVGRVYEVRGLADYPRYVLLMSNTKKQIPIPFWDNGYFEPSSKEEFDKQELLDKAKRDYPIGTMLNSKHGVQKVLGGEPFIGISIPGTIQINTDQFTGGASIYTLEDGWCERLPIKFTTEDGVNICGDMKTYMVYSNLTMSNKNINNEGTNSAIKYFYHKENALAYIKENTQRSLEDYEKLLLDSTVDYSIDKTYYSFMAFYNMLKMKEPKLYYTKVLQLIADDLNDGWVANFSGVNNPVKYYLTSSGWNTSFNIDIPGVVYFKSEKVSSKAKDILGDKVKFLFN